MSLLVIILILALVLVIYFIISYQAPQHKAFHINLESDTIQNKDYRRVIYTGPKQQLVLMSLNVSEDIPAEVHDGTQFFRIEKGKGMSSIWENGKNSPPTNIELSDGSGLIIPPGTQHYIKNISSTEPLKLYSIYSPPQHPAGTVHNRQSDDHEHG